MTFHTAEQSDDSSSEPASYRTEFPEMGELEIALPDGFRDISRRVDGMPTFARTLSPAKALPVAEILLTVSAADPSRRAAPESPRFTLMVMQDHAELLASFESDDYQEILTSIAMVEEEYRRQISGTA